MSGDTMQLHEISAENFRAKEAVRLTLGSRLTLLIGENGTGKTTVLDAIAIALSVVFKYLPDRKNIKGISFREGDILKKMDKSFPMLLLSLYVRIMDLNGILCVNAIVINQQKSKFQESEKDFVVCSNI